MVNDDGNPSALPSRRRMRTHAEWNVDTHIFSATGPTSAATRCFISSAALLVNVIARISKGLTPRSWMRWAMRVVRTLVFALPAPATSSGGPSVWAAASRWTGLSPSRRPRSPPSSKGPGGGVTAATTPPSYNLGICSVPAYAGVDGPALLTSGLPLLVLLVGFVCGVWLPSGRV